MTAEAALRLGIAPYNDYLIMWPINVAMLVTSPCCGMRKRPRIGISDDRRTGSVSVWHRGGMVERLGTFRCGFANVDKTGRDLNVRRITTWDR